MTRGSLHALMTFDALGAAELREATPLLVVHGRTDAYCAPELAEELYTRTQGERKMHWVDAAGHVDLYDNEPNVAEAVAVRAKFLHGRD